MTFNSIEDIATYFGTTVNRLEHDVYKYTDCGAWVSWDDGSVSIGSIVEGSDAEFSKTFSFPFTSRELEAWLEDLENLTDEAWHEANDDPDYEF